MNVIIEKSKLCGEIAAPPSKSIAHRYLILAALSGEKTVIYNFPENDDVAATANCLKKLGAKIKIENGTAVCDGFSLSEKEILDFECNESASTLRFIMPVALAFGKTAVFHGSERLISRPLTEYEKIFNISGIELVKSKNEVLARGTLKAGLYSVLGNISSQFASGLLMALPLCNGNSRLIVKELESRPYVDLTLAAMESFGVKVNNFSIKGMKYTSKGEYFVEGDESAAAVFGALGDSIKITGLANDTLQGDKVWREIFNKLENSTPEISLANCPDLAPIAFVVAALNNGAKFTDTGRLKIKESDRALSMKEELSKFGVKLTVNENSVTVEKSEIYTPQIPLSAHNDHRIAMALAVLSSKFGGEITNAEAVTKSYPDFWKDFRALGGRITL